MGEILEIKVSIKVVIILCVFMTFLYVCLVAFARKHMKERDQWVIDYNKLVKKHNELDDNYNILEKNYEKTSKCQEISYRLHLEQLSRNEKLVRKIKHLESNIKNCLRNI